MGPREVGPILVEILATCLAQAAPPLKRKNRHTMPKFWFYKTLYFALGTTSANFTARVPFCDIPLPDIDYALHTTHYALHKAHTQRLSIHQYAVQGETAVQNSVASSLYDVCTNWTKQGFWRAALRDGRSLRMAYVGLYFQWCFPAYAVFVAYDKESSQGRGKG